MDEIKVLDTPTVPAAPPAKPVLPLIKSGGREIELKFLVTAPGFKASQSWALLGQPARLGRRAPSQRLRSVYFDTENADLRRHQLVLRMRAQRRGYMMACKWNGAFPGGLFERGEIEIATSVAEPDPALLGVELAAFISSCTQGQALLPVYATDIRRMTHRLRTGTSEIELAFDAGFILAGDQKLPVREIEMELKSGDPADLYRLGIELAETYPVRLGCQSKSERGALLSTGTPPAPVRASPALAGAPTVDEAIATLINDCISQFAGNFPAFESGDSVTAVHQMRVAMRRLRAMLGLFHRAFPCPEFLAFRQMAKDAASAMGEARNWDVFLLLLRAGPLAAFPQEAGFGAVISQSERQRAAGYEAVRARLAAPETTRLVLSMQAFVARRGWRNVMADGALPRLTAPAGDFAGENLNRLHNRLLKRGKHFAAMPPHERHELRIDLKKLRYAADCFGGLFDSPKPVRNYTKMAAKLQDQLGLYNDLIVTQQLVARLDTDDLPTTRAVGIILGWCARGARTDDESLRETWQDFRKTKLFF